MKQAEKKHSHPRPGRLPRIYDAIQADGWKETERAAKIIAKHKATNNKKQAGKVLQKLNSQIQWFRNTAEINLSISFWC